MDMVERDIVRAAGFPVAGVFLWVHGPVTPRLRARALRGLPEKTGETRSVVDGTGVRMTAATCDTGSG
ncbi:hypothetical protein ACFXA3_41900, partial [Streptomyces sp. NPDC059456]|uniref:hypothetical protein n=1 Tax=Streptomyces sp. NPDC059456 TaxID=3346838 RepID=UPI0036BD1E52